MDVQQLENEIQRIKERNLRVEADKAWEVSWIRKVSVAILTYAVAVASFLVLGVEVPWLAAIVPTAAFALSTLSLGVMKKVWLKRFRSR